MSLDVTVQYGKCMNVPAAFIIFTGLQTDKHQEGLSLLQILCWERTPSVLQRPL